MPANPANALVRCGFEGTRGYGDVTTWKDMRIRSEALGAELPGIEDDSIIENAEQPETLESKIDAGGDLALNWTPNDHAEVIAAFFGSGKTPVLAPAGVYTHRFAVSESDVAWDTLAVEVSRDLGRPTLYTSCMPSVLNFNVGPRSLLNGTAGIVTPRFHYFGDAVEVAVGTTPDPPIPRGYPIYSQLVKINDDEARLYLKVDGAPVVDDFDILTKVGAAASYGTTDNPFTAGLWGPNGQFDGIWDESDVAFGEFGVPVELLWESTTAMVTDDEWYLPMYRTVWSQSLPVASALNEVYCIITLDGTKFRTRDVACSLTRPIELDEVVGGRFVDEIIEQGQRTATWTLNRRAIDNDLVYRLLRAESFEMELTAYGPEIAATGVRHSMKLISKNCKPSGRTPSVGGRDTFDESLTATAHPSGDGTYPSAVTCELVNSQAVI